MQVGAWSSAINNVTTGTLTMAGSACDECARNGIIDSEGSRCPVCADVANPEELIPYRLFRDKVRKCGDSSDNISIYFSTG